MLESGLRRLPSVTVDSYNLEIRDKNGFIGDQATNRAFFDIIADLRTAMRKTGTDPFKGKRTSKLSKRTLEHVLNHGDAHAAGLLMSAVEEFSQTLSTVIARFLKEKAWQGTKRIVVGGGMRNSRAGELAIGRTTTLLRLAGTRIELVPIRNDPDHAGLIGVAHLIPPEMIEGYRAMLAVDIGGSSMRTGILKLPKKPTSSLRTVSVWKMRQWKYAKEDRQISRKQAMEGLASLIEKSIQDAQRAGKELLPIIGIGCPGEIDPDGNILVGGQNLPGNWEGKNFNLPEQLLTRLPKVNGSRMEIVMHNDAVVQGLSEVPNMLGVRHWGVVTIGTGLGNARFSSLGSNDA